jgi:hypothetical protein
VGNEGGESPVQLRKKDPERLCKLLVLDSDEGSRTLQGEPVSRVLARAPEMLGFGR